MKVLGIEVDDGLSRRWRGWLMPERQPYVVPRAVADEHGWRDDRAALSFELKDSFELYTIGDDRSLVWLTRSESRRVPQDCRRSQPGPHRWPTVDVGRDVTRVVRWVESGRRPSAHRDVTEEQWALASELLPGARTLAGTFADRSGPNCFATVMAAAGVEGASEQWMQLAPFEAWLRSATVPGGRDEDPGTVLVWRTDGGSPAHAAVTLGSGWLLHKPSQGWMSPTKVLTVRDGKFSSRVAGRRLTRRRLSAR